MYYTGIKSIREELQNQNSYLVFSGYILRDNLLQFEINCYNYGIPALKSKN